MRHFVLVVAATFAFSCGSNSPVLPPDAGPTYCAEQSEAIAGMQKPAKIMLALDRSGSMKTLASSDTQWGCAADGSGNGYNPSGDCKWITLLDLLTRTGGFLDQTSASARHGLAIFSGPNSSDSCAAGSIEVPVPDAAGASVQTIKSKLFSYAPSGGTPSASTLGNIAADSSFTRNEVATKSAVVLITDGNPNCNSSLSLCSACTNGGNPAQMCGDVRNCLDDVALTAAVKTLKAKTIDTFVIGFGSAFSNPDAKKALNDAAEAGGRTANDPDYPDAKFFLAANTEKLEGILDKIRTVLQACTFALDQAAVTESSLVVTVSNKKAGTEATLESGTDWSFTDGSRTALNLGDVWCKKLQEAEADTYVVKFQHLQCQP